MLKHMRTSVDLSEAVLQRAKKLAKQRKTSMRALIEEGLRLLSDRQEAVSRYRLVDCSYGEGGMQPGIASEDWATLRDLVYEGRGG